MDEYFKESWIFQQFAFSNPYARPVVIVIEIRRRQRWRVSKLKIEIESRKVSKVFYDRVNNIKRAVTLPGRRNTDSDQAPVQRADDPWKPASPEIRRK